MQDTKAKLNDIISKCLEHFAEMKLHSPMEELDSLPYMPILWFGDLEAYFKSNCKVVTLSINPSWREFYVDKNDHGWADRFDKEVVNRIYEESRKDVPQWEGQLIEEYKKELNSYFKRNPYRSWFSGFCNPLAVFQASYCASMPNRALHIDLVSPIPTYPAWGKLNKGKRDNFIIFRDSLVSKFLGILQPDYILTSLARSHFDGNENFECLAGKLYYGKLHDKYTIFQRTGVRGTPCFTAEEVKKMNDFCQFSDKRGNSKPIIVVGNGVNLVAGRNADLSYNKVWEKYTCESDGEKRLKPEFFEKCGNLRPSFAHYALASLSHYVDSYFTTNYDHALEAALDCEVDYPTPEVVHLHGSYKNSSSCVFFPHEYDSKLEEIKKASWYFDFIESKREIHLCGLALHSTEKTLYHLLNERRKRLKELGDFEDGGLKRVYAWLTFETKDREETEKLADALRDLSVHPLLIQVHDGDYISAWETLIGRMLLRFEKIFVSRCDSKKLKHSKTPQCVTRNMNVSYASEVCLKYPDCCRMSIQFDTLAKHKDSENWLFCCEIERKYYLWKISLSELFQIVGPTENEGSFSFYLNYRNGSLCHCSEKQDSDVRLVTHCSSVANMVEFDELVK